MDSLPGIVFLGIVFRIDALLLKLSVAVHCLLDPFSPLHHQ
jgi:hypothetical protein